MKKAIFAGIAVLAALAVISCFGSFEPETEEIQYTADGRPLLNLTIGDPSGRALTNHLAQVAANYYEVAFVDSNGDVYRTSWVKGRIGRIRLPADDYDGVDKAVMFAGRLSDKTLLAVGLLTSVDGASTSVISSSTQSIQFTLYPLLTNVRADPASSFQVTIDSTKYPGYVNTGGYTTANFPHFTDESAVEKPTVPLFLVPKNATGNDVTAELTITIPPGPDPLLPLTFEDDIADGIYVSGAGTTTSSGLTGGMKSTNNVTATITAPSATPATIPDGVIKFQIATQDTDYYAQMHFEIPVYAIDDTDAVTGLAPVQWYIRGGLENHLLDEGEAKESAGGAIVFGVGAVTYITVGSGP